MPRLLQFPCRVYRLGNIHGDHECVYGISSWRSRQKGPWQPWSSWIIMIRHDEWWWFMITSHHDASAMLHEDARRWFVMARHDASWGCVVLMPHDDSSWHVESWWLIMMIHDDPSRWITVSQCVALKGFLSGLSWPFLPWAPWIDATHLLRVPIANFQAENGNMGMGTTELARHSRPRISLQLHLTLTLKTKSC